MPRQVRLMVGIAGLSAFLFGLVAPASADPLIYYNFETDLANQGTGGAAYNPAVTGTPQAGWTGGGGRPGGIAGAGGNFVAADNDVLSVAAGTAQLGSSFAVSSWHYLSPGSPTPTRH